MGGSRPNEPIPAARPSFLTRALRCWWVLFAAVPFAWLACVAFVVAGIRARRGSWVGVGVLYALVIWGATIVASVEELPTWVRQAGGLVIFFGWPIGFLHALALTPRFVRAIEQPGPEEPPRYLPPLHATAVTAPPSPPQPAPRELLQVPGWTRSWAGGRVRFGLLVAFDVLLLLGGLLFLASDVRVAAVMLLFGLGTMLTLPMFRVWHRPGRVALSQIPDRPGRIGLYFPYARGKYRANMVGLFLMALACGVFAIVDNPPVQRLAGLLAFGVLGLNALRHLSGGHGHPYVALTQDGVSTRFGASAWFVPWDVIDDVAAVEINMRSAREQFVGLSVSDRNRVEISRTGRAMLRVNRWFGADLSFTTRGLDVDPALLLYAIHYYWRHPDARTELAGSDAVARVERLDLFDRPAGSPPGTTGTYPG